ncbi:hypothetical protein [Nostoc sp.]|uniref:hypothetical protein n=1 Tax=Nostoc sp. TaxID=1180 RepID=UPI002FF6204C
MTVVLIFRDWGLGTGDWGLGTGDWGLGIGDWGRGRRIFPSALRTLTLRLFSMPNAQCPMPKES